MITIRYERPEDRETIYQLNELAFAGTDEAILVDTLRNSREPILSMVALLEDRIVGHILFSPVVIHKDDTRFERTKRTLMYELEAEDIQISLDY